MSRTAVGAVTIMDIQDGVHPLSVILSNQSHTFAADHEGTVAGTEKDKFMCEINAYVGGTRIDYDPAGTPANNTYKLGTIVDDPSSWVSQTTEVSNQIQISMLTIPTGVTLATAQIELPILIKNSLGNTTQVDMVISLAKAIEGTGGQVIYMEPDRQTFKFDEFGVTTDGTVSIKVSSAGLVGSLSVEKSIDGGVWSTLTVGAGADQAASIDIDGSGDDDEITITAANFSDTNNLAIKVVGATGGVDVVGLVRIQDGSTGPAALIVSITSDVGGFAFKNNTGATKTLTVVVWDAATGNVVIPTAFQWKKNGGNVGTSQDTFAVNATDITDNGSEQYSCEVTY